MTGMRKDAGDAAPAGLFGERIALRQPARGHRAGTDAVLLAAAAGTGWSEGVDVGAGVGAVGLLAAVACPSSSIGLLEIGAELCALARENVALNGMEARARVFCCDVFDAKARLAAGLRAEAADLVLTNPPFHAQGRVRVTPDEAKARAHVSQAPLSEWTRAALALLAPGGAFAMIHRAAALGECLAATEGRLGAVSILPIAPRAGEAATRIILRGRKGSKAPQTLLAPLVLHEADGRFTRRAEALHRGKERLRFS